MCFSAETSFGAALILGALGAATLAQRPEPRRIAFASIPLIFAAHQAIEGAIWLSMPEGGPPQSLILAYLAIALVFWPVFTPFAVLLIERDPRRRIGLGVFLAAGIALAVILASVLGANAYSVTLVDGNLRYSTDHVFEERLIGLYVVVTAAPLLLSRHRYVMAFGAAVLAGSFATALAFYHAAASVWCFFAALGSAFVFLHVRRQKRLREAHSMPMDLP
ncbi:MAG: DUF6629 family protein [Pseudomonadota bacterium]